MKKKKLKRKLKLANYRIENLRQERTAYSKFLYQIAESNSPFNEAAAALLLQFTPMSLAELAKTTTMDDDTYKKIADSLATKNPILDDENWRPT